MLARRLFENISRGVNSHKDVLQCLEKQYGEVAPLTNTWVGIKDYLGVVLDFSTKVKVRVIIIKHIQSILDTDPTDIYGLAETPDAKHLFQVQEDDGDLTAHQ